MYLKSKIIALVTVLTILTCQTGFSQNRAPSCWLKYSDNFKGDILVNTVRVQSPSPTYTYYCTLQWNAGMEGGGYCGIQEHPDGRNFIYSIWDPLSSSDAITAPYTHPGTEIESFGGEGTGLKSWNFDIGWSSDQWYSFVTRAWDENEHTMFGYWVFNHTDQEWYHLVTMDFPVAGVRFSSSTGSFIEDWAGSGENQREVHHKEGWKRASSNQSWYPFTSAKFERVSPDAGAFNFINTYDGGIDGDHYYMKSGGAALPVTNASGATLSLANSNSNPGFPSGEIHDFTALVNSSNLSLTWSIDSASSPQFSSHLQIFNTPDLTGEPIIQIDQADPEQRELYTDIASLLPGKEYYIVFSIIDIFDQQSVAVSHTFTTEEIIGVKPNRPEKMITCYPNPFKNELNLKFGWEFESIEIKLHTLTGKTVMQHKYYSRKGITEKLPESLLGGIYFLTLTDNSGNQQTLKLIKN